MPYHSKKQEKSNSNLVVQAVRLSKKKFKTQKDAKEQAKKMNFKVSVRPNPQYANFWSFRQIQPEKFVKSSFRTKVVNPNISLIVGKLK